MVKDENTVEQVRVDTTGGKRECLHKPMTEGGQVPKTGVWRGPLPAGQHPVCRRRRSLHGAPAALGEGHRPRSSKYSSSAKKS